MAIRVLICIALLFVIIQDFKFRAVHWIIFPVLWALMVADSLLRLRIIDYIFGSAVNLLIIVVQGGILYAYYFANGKDLRYIRSILGVGDVLFIVIMAFAFTWTSFMFYYIVGLLFALLLWLIIIWLSKKQKRLIPLAGLLAIYMMIIMIIDIVLPDFDRSINIMHRYIVYGN